MEMHGMAGIVLNDARILPQIDDIGIARLGRIARCKSIVEPELLPNVLQMKHDLVRLVAAK
ncbi:hypothetical protein X742_09855 [Mesorhizobium sp. LNHC232B00]|nr:hypothetical protein X742_09855 [Mesorhizobium sp. LNHC232B00]